MGWSSRVDISIAHLSNKVETVEKKHKTLICISVVRLLYIWRGTRPSGSIVTAFRLTLTLDIFILGNTNMQKKVKVRVMNDPCIFPPSQVVLLAPNAESKRMWLELIRETAEVRNMDVSQKLDGLIASHLALIGIRCNQLHG